MVWALLLACASQRAPPAEDDAAMAVEVCDGVDNDGDGLVDDDDPSLNPDSGAWAFADADQDGFGTPSPWTERRCDPGDWATTADDCDDKDAAIRPGAEEICDDIDNDCDGLVDRLDPDCVLRDARMTYRDDDQDGFGGAPFFACGTGGSTSDTPGDCDDSAADTFPGAFDLCDGVDNACQGSEDGCVPAVRLEGSYITGGSVVESAAFGSDSTGSWVALGFPESGDLVGGLPVGAVYLLALPAEDVDLGAAPAGWIRGGEGSQGAGRFLRFPGDVDGDGAADLLVVSRVTYYDGREWFDEGEVSLFLGPLSGALEPHWTVMDREPATDADGGLDLTGDGRPDIAVNGGAVWVTYQGGYGVAILDATLTGTLSPQDAPLLIDAAAYSVLLHPDLDGDGQADLVLGTTVGVMAIPGPIDTSSGWADFAHIQITEYEATDISLVPDLDGDGVEDLTARAYAPTSGIAVVSSRSGERALLTFDEGASTAVDDLDGDGLAEIAVGTADGGATDDDAGAVWIFAGTVEGALTANDAIAILPGTQPDQRVGTALAWTPGTLLVGDATGAWFVDTSAILGP